MDALRIQSKFIIVDPDRCLHPGQLVVRHGRVVEVTHRLNQPADLDLGDAVLLPGLINAHTHLEFSSLDSPFAAGENFPQWISQVVAYRRSLLEPHSAAGPLAHLQTALMAGLRESFNAGSVVVGDIVTPPWQASLLPSPSDFARERALRHGDEGHGGEGHGGEGHGGEGRGVGESAAVSASNWQTHLGPVCFPRVVAIRELLGLSAERLHASWQWAVEADPQAQSELLAGYGLSPHAPYSIHFPSIERALGKTSPATIVAMHVAESQAELEWIAAEQGPFQEVFNRLGITPEARPPSIDQCIDLLSGRQHGLLIHGNYLTPALIDQVASAGGITIVFCPRTHTHFGHDRYPLERMRSAGVPIALGTDSRASNPDLNLWEELAQVKRLFPQLTGRELLQWVTTAPAQALGLESDFGSLAPGRLAAACVARVLPHWTAKNLLDEMCQRSASELALAPLCNSFGQRTRIDKTEAGRTF